MPALRVRRKWRPRLSLVIALVCGLSVAMPVIGVIAARIVDNQFVRATEQGLKVQASLFAEAYALRLASELAEPDFGHKLDARQQDRRAARFDAVTSELAARVTTVLPPLPDPVPAEGETSGLLAPIVPFLEALARQAQRRTLAGYIATDHQGRIIAASGEQRGSLAHLPEIAAALAGEDAASLRQRGDLIERHPLQSLSRNTGQRVFVAQPVILRNRVVGAVLLSRTPGNLELFLFEERHTLVTLALLLAGGTLLIGWVFFRLISRPMQNLARQSRAVADQSQPLPHPLAHYGVEELAELGNAVLSMAQSLRDRATMIENYTAHVTHELKSPTTAILGAAELLQSGQAHMPNDRRERLLVSIGDQARRMDDLLERLRLMARMRLSRPGPRATLAQLASYLSEAGLDLTVRTDGPGEAAQPWTAEQAEIAVIQLAANAVQHGATSLTLSFDPRGPSLGVHDNGKGIAKGQLERVIEPFYTTRREAGGTGMGLAIAAAIAETSGGSLRAEASECGASFIFDWSDNRPDKP